MRLYRNSKRSRIASQAVAEGDVEQILKDYPAPETLTEDEAREDIRRAIQEHKILMECRVSGKYQPWYDFLGIPR